MVCHHIKTLQTATVAPEVVHYSPHGLHRHRFEDMSSTCRVHSKAPEDQTEQMVIPGVGTAYSYCMCSSCVGDE